MSKKVKVWSLAIAYLIVGVFLLYVFEQLQLPVGYYLVVAFFMFLLSAHLVFGKYKSLFPKDTIGVYHIGFYSFFNAVLEQFTDLGVFSLFIAFGLIAILYLISFAAFFLKSKFDS